MGKGTPSMGKKARSKSHITCRRCGRHSYSIRRRRCAACGYGESKRIREYSWQNKKVNRIRIV
ncbi:MAG: 50S ribosomal protein L37e [Candidatus Bathyarchaeia archaeon]|nr:50S ribosomal protein L37e [Candidatus Bathyarchaeota archaeon]MBS7629215.1 50S ribosomal protein L37e [Candidatus Bathyarchaeota archaeon]MBS7651348.1 50S ribosomal protein L37e [Candidatus Bathyarchaeota archaeon]